MKRILSIGFFIVIISILVSPLRVIAQEVNSSNSNLPPLPPESNTPIPQVKNYKIVDESRFKDDFQQVDQIFGPHQWEDRAKKLYEISQKGSGEALYKLGKLYTDSFWEDVPDRNSVEKYILNCYLTDAERNNIQCIWALIYYYKSGDALGLPKTQPDMEKYHAYLSQAVALGDPTAKNWIENDNKEKEKEADVKKNDHFLSLSKQKFNAQKIFSTDSITDYDRSVLDDFMKNHRRQYYLYTNLLEQNQENTGQVSLNLYFKLPSARNGDQPTKDEFLVEFIHVKKDFFNAWKKNKNPVIRKGIFTKTLETQKEIRQKCKQLFAEDKPNELTEFLMTDIFQDLNDAQNADYKKMISEE